MAGLQGSGKTTATGKLARYLREQHGSSVAVAACDVYRPAAVDQLVKVGHQAGAAVYEQGTDRNPVRDRQVGAGTGQDRGQGRADRRHQRPAARRPGADGRAGRHQEGGRAARHPARGRRDDRPGRRQRRRAVRGGGRLRRGRDDQARRRRPRRRGAVGQGDHRQADHVRLHRREARPVRALPPRPDGAADPRHGRRHDPDREGRGQLRRGAGGRARAQAAQAGVRARRLPRPDAPGPPARSAAVAAGDDPGARQGAARGQARRAGVRPPAGDHPLDDARRSAATRS